MGCFEEVVSESPVRNSHGTWHSCCYNIYRVLDPDKVWKITRHEACLEIPGACQINQAFESLSHWEDDLRRLWRAFNDFEAAMITNFMLLRSRLTHYRSNVTLECASVLLEHTHELIRTCDRKLGNDSGSRWKALKAARAQILTLNCTIIDFLNDSTNLDSLPTRTLAKLKIALKESAFDLDIMIRYVVMATLTQVIIINETPEMINFVINHISRRTFNMALKPPPLPPRAPSRTLEVDALSLQSIKWRYSVMGTARLAVKIPEEQHSFSEASATSESSGRTMDEEAREEARISRSLSKRKSCSAFKFKRGNTISLLPSPFITDKDFSISKPDSVKETKPKRATRNAHAVFLGELVVPQPVQPKRESIYKRIGSLQAIHDEYIEEDGVNNHKRNKSFTPMLKRKKTQVFNLIKRAISFFS